MKDILIPTLLNSGQENKRLHRYFILFLLLALFLHILFFIALATFNKNPFFFLFPAEEEIAITSEEHLNYVLVDEKVLDEQLNIKEEVTSLGRVSRQSRGENIDLSLPKTGPESDEDTAISAFQKGSPDFDSIAMPEIAPTPPPAPKVNPSKQNNPSVKQEVIAKKPQEPVEKALEKTSEPKKQILPELPDISFEEDTKGLFPKLVKAEKPEKTQQPDKTEVPGINAEDTISQLIKQESILQKPQEFEPQQTPQQVQKKIPTRRIQVKQIGSQSNKTGGKMKRRLNTTAVISGSRSIAVLRDKYGIYMDKILRRIQSAINIQQQINPIALHEGFVVMSFTINQRGILDEINFIGSKPDNNSSEISAARSVLKDVQNGDPFEPPSQEMLNDPNFQKIVINFVFENR